jgi:hypothetical protein
LQNDDIILEEAGFLEFGVDMEIGIRAVKIVDRDSIDIADAIEQLPLNDGGFEARVGKNYEDLHRACFGPTTLVAAIKIAMDWAARRTPARQAALQKARRDTAGCEWCGGRPAHAGRWNAASSDILPR